MSASTQYSSYAYGEREAGRVRLKGRERKIKTTRQSEVNYKEAEKRGGEGKGQGERVGELGTKEEETGEGNGRRQANEQVKKRERMGKKSVREGDEGGRSVASGRQAARPPTALKH